VLGANLPPMGLRVRLKASVRISGLPYQARIVAAGAQALRAAPRRQRLALVHLGAPDRHWNNDALHLLDALSGRDFEVVDTRLLPHPTR